MTKQLIVSADDFGLSLEVNEAVERAHRDGILRAASLMVFCSFCDQDYDRFQVIFGVARRDHPAIAVIRDVIERFPSHDRSREYDVFVIADADMRVLTAHGIASCFHDTSCATSWSNPGLVH